MGGRGRSSEIEHNFGGRVNRSGYTFKRDGSEIETEEFFRNNSNNFDLIDGLTRQQEKDFTEYTKGELMEGQQYKGWDSMNDKERQITQTLDDIIDQSIVSRSIVVNRTSDAQLIMGAGNKTATVQQLKNMEGKVITSRAHTSYSAAPQGLIIEDTGGTKIQYRLHVPGGKKGAGMYTGDVRVNFWGSKQREYIANRDIKIKVGKTTETEGGIIVDVYYVGKSKHDYGRTGRR